MTSSHGWSAGSRSDALHFLLPLASRRERERERVFSNLPLLSTTATPAHIQPSPPDLHSIFFLSLLYLREACTREMRVSYFIFCFFFFFYSYAK